MHIQTYTRLLLPALLVVATAGAAAAQAAPKSDAPKSDAPAPRVGTPTVAQLQGVVPGLTLATKLKGANVVDAASKTLGEVADVLVHSPDAVFVIVDRDGGGLVAVPLQWLEARLEIEQDDVDDAVEDRHDGQRPETPAVDSLLLLAPTERLVTARSVEKDRLESLDAAAVVAIRQHWEGQESTAPKSKPVATADAVVVSRMSVAAAVGDQVKSSTGEELGEIKDVVIDLATGKVAYVLLSSGGVLGAGATLHGVALDALAHDSGKGYTLNTDRKTLDTSPGIDLDRLPSRPSFQITAKASLSDGSSAQKTPR